MVLHAALIQDTSRKFQETKRDMDGFSLLYAVNGRRNLLFALARVIATVKWDSSVYVLRPKRDDCLFLRKNRNTLEFSTSNRLNKILLLQHLEKFPRVVDGSKVAVAKIQRHARVSSVARVARVETPWLLAELNDVIAWVVSNDSPTKSLGYMRPKLKVLLL